MNVTRPPSAATTPSPGGPDALPLLPPEIRDFCDRHGLAEHVATTARLLRETFPPPGEVTVGLFTDPEAEDGFSWVTVRVRAAGDVAALLRAQERFFERWIPATPAAVRDRISASFSPA